MIPTTPAQSRITFCSEIGETTVENLTNGLGCVRVIEASAGSTHVCVLPAKIRAPFVLVHDVNVILVVDKVESSSNNTFVLHGK